MKKALSKMSLEELWQLFPILLIEHQSIWNDWYLEEEQFLYALFPQQRMIQIHHIGSTAITCIMAKPIIDILVEIPHVLNIDDMAHIISENGYLCMSKSEHRISLNKGYTEDGFAEKVFHIHLRYIGDHDELYFRDYLNEDNVAAKAYEALKYTLWKQYEFQRDAYTEAKSDFIHNITTKAKKRYKDRYE